MLSIVMVCNRSMNVIDCRVMMYREHSKVVLTCRSQDNARMVSGCTDGIIKVRILLRVEHSTYLITQPYKQGGI